jgi:D-arabinose 1-dehydrogenase-like Zn-dependent alcohol dehydrogenase
MHIYIHYTLYIIHGASRIVKLKESLRPQELKTPKSKAFQVLIKVKSAAVCYSDIFIYGKASD